MTFTDAVNQMRLGEKLVLPKWNGYYAVILEGQNYMWLIGMGGTSSTINATVYTPDVSDILSTEWIVKPKKGAPQ